MAKIGNETKLVLKLAAERAKPAKSIRAHRVPSEFLLNDSLKEAIEWGIREGINLYKTTLDDIIFDIENR